MRVMDKAPVVPSGTARNQLKLGGLIIATAVVLYLCYRVLLPFFPALTWATALAVIAQPLHRFLARWLRKRTVSSLVTVIFVTVAIILPLVFVTEQVISEAVSAVNTVRSPEFRQRIDAGLKSHPRLASGIDWLQARVNIGEQVQSLAGSAGAKIPAAFAGSLAGLGQLFIALFTLFFFLRDFELFVNALRSVIPLSAKDADEVLHRVRLTIDASVRGRVLIAVIQGFLGGMMFWILGLPAPLLWGTVMVLLSLVPMLGAFLVWVPAALILALSGHAGKALILTAWGIVVIGTADNFLYPILVGKDIRLHTVVIFFAVLGGVAAFGASGLVVGPVIFALTDALIEIWTRRSLPREPAGDLIAK
jgi:predicted PurR-regulated permease PerM